MTGHFAGETPNSSTPKVDRQRSGATFHGRFNFYYFFSHLRSYPDYLTPGKTLHTAFARVSRWEASSGWLFPVRLAERPSCPQLYNPGANYES